jgi:SAM-dependent methyltransferase
MRARLRGLLRRPPRGLDYWKWRAARYGAHAVAALGHAERDLAELTRTEWAELLPRLRRRLRGDERLALDYGCGCGRFTALLARAIDGRALGIDPVAELLALAAPDPGVEYRLLQDGRVPLPDARADVAFVHLVLGGIADGPALRAAAAEITRALAPEGLLFVVENTSEQPDQPHWRFRDVEAYRRLFPDFDLTHEGDRDDLGERVSILAGRRRGAVP